MRVGHVDLSLLLSITELLLRYSLRIIFNRFRRAANATESERVRRQADFPGLNKKTKMTHYRYFDYVFFSQTFKFQATPSLTQRSKSYIITEIQAFCSSSTFFSLDHVSTSILHLTISKYYSKFSGRMFASQRLKS